MPWEPDGVDTANVTGCRVTCPECNECAAKTLALGIRVASYPQGYRFESCPRSLSTFPTPDWQSRCRLGFFVIQPCEQDLLGTARKARFSRRLQSCYRLVICWKLLAID